MKYHSFLTLLAWRLTAIIGILAGILIRPLQVLAQTNNFSKAVFGEAAAPTPTSVFFEYWKNGGKFQDPGFIIARVIQVILGFLGVIFLCLVLYGGFLWMTAAGEDDKVKKAMSIITQATLGLIIVLAAWSISYFIMVYVFQAVNNPA